MKNIKTMNNKKFIKSCEELLDIALCDFSECGFLRPTAYVFFIEKGKMVVIDYLVENEEERNLLPENIKRLVKALDANAVLIISENWIAQYKDKNDMNSIRPSEHPERKEIIYANLQQKSGKEITWITPIIRDDEEVLLCETQEYEKNILERGSESYF